MVSVSLSGIVFIFHCEFQVFLRMILEPELVVTGHNEMWKGMIHKIAPALISVPV